MPDIRLRNIFRSLFFKLLVVILLTGICINLLVFGFFRHALHGAEGSQWAKYLRLYSEYIMEDLGQPPDRQHAEQLDRKYGIATEWIGDPSSWRTQNAQPIVTQRHPRLLFQDTQTRITFYGRHHQIVVDQPQGRFIFTFARPFVRQEQTYLHFGILIGLLTVVLVVAYLVLRRLLHPIKLLRSGARRIGEGQLDTRIQTRASNELGDLAAGFNTMAGQVQEMLRAREQLLLNVSHELRTPLTRTKVALEFLPESKARQSIHEDVVEMEAMVTNILETARMGNGSLELERRQVDLVQILQETVKHYRHQSPGIKDTPVASPVHIMADPARVKTVFDNVLTNAVKYSLSDSAPIQIAFEKKAAEVVVNISDDGIGIPKEELDRVYDPFYRIEKSRSKATGGYGLGLGLCKSIMEAHGGSIEIFNRKDRGTTVRLVFPLEFENTSGE